MIDAALSLLLASGGIAGQPIGFTQFILRQRVVVRVPAQSTPATPRADVPLREKRGPKCIPLDGIAGAAVMAPGSVDLVLKGGDRYRARFASSCPDLDYYSGFYLLPTKDGKLCADRDVIRARSGGQCEIQKFRTLVPAK